MTLKFYIFSKIQSRSRREIFCVLWFKALKSKSLTNMSKVFDLGFLRLFNLYLMKGFLVVGDYNYKKLLDQEHQLLSPNPKPMHNFFLLF